MHAPVFHIARDPATLGYMIAFLHRRSHIITLVYYSFRGVHCLNNRTMVIHVWLLVAIVLWTSD